jgi:hypothetical protein
MLAFNSAGSDLKTTRGEEGDEDDDLNSILQG